MTRRLLQLALALPLALAVVALPAGPATAGHGAVERTKTFLDDVNEAVDRGAEWLIKQQRNSGSFANRYAAYPASGTAMAYLTLRVCGVSRTDARMRKAYRALRTEYETARNANTLRTYTAALIMMAIEEHGRGATGESGKRTRYAEDSERTTRLDEPDLEWMRELVEYMEFNQNTNGAWRYGQQVSRYKKKRAARRNPNDYDHSNTQYALLGLKSASRSGVKVDPSIYEKALKHLISAQQKNGPEVPRVAFEGRYGTFAREKDKARGWSYMSLANTTQQMRGQLLGGAYGSMTAGSLGAVVICRSELLGWSEYSRRMDREAEDSVWDGIAWLGKHFSVTENPGLGGGWHLYYLYALERAGVLAGVDWMGENDWYGEGAEYLLGTQQRNGRWQQDGDELVSTCFALLFLKKGTIPVTRGAVTPSGAADNIDFEAARLLRGKDLDDFVDLVISRWGRARSDSDRKKLRRGAASVGPRVVLPLLRRMGAGNDRQREPAHAVLAAITGLDLPFDAAAPAEQRFDTLMPFEEWYMARADRLAFDEKSGRLVTR